MAAITVTTAPSAAFTPCQGLCQTGTAAAPWVSVCVLTATTAAAGEGVPSGTGRLLAYSPVF